MGRLNKTSVGDFDEWFLRVVLDQAGKAYGISIYEAMTEAGIKNPSISQVYATADRLDRLGFIKTETGEPTEERGGRAKTFFRITDDGIEQLREVERLRSRWPLGSQAAGGLA